MEGADGLRRRRLAARRRRGRGARPALCRPRDRALALGAGHSIGVTVAGLGLLVVVARVAGPRTPCTASPASVRPALAGGALGGRRRAAGAPGRSAPTRCPRSGALAAIGVGVLAAAIVLVVAAAVMMGTARAPLTGAVHALRTTGDSARRDRQEVHGDRAVAPARPPDRRGAGHQRRRRRQRTCARSSPRSRAAGADVRVCGAPATEELFGFSAAGADFRPVGISSGLAPVADTRAVLQLRRATAGADLVHAHGLRAGLVAAAARRLSGERHRPAGADAAQRPAGELGPRQRLLRAVEGLTIRGGRPRARRLQRPGRQRPPAGARDVRVVPALAPPLPPAPASRAEVRDELGVDDGRPLVVAVGRLHPQKGYDVLFDAVGRWSAAAG